LVLLLIFAATALSAQDTLLVATADSLKTKKDEGIKDPVDYGSEDSLFFDLYSQKAFLFGTAYLKMGSFELKSGYIEVDFKKQIIYARGIADSTGTIVQKPEYSEGAETFIADEVIYDYKSRKGTVKGVRTEQQDGYLFAEQAKMQDNGEYHFANGRYTTCSHPDHPHYYIKMTKAKVVDGNKIVTGPFYFVIEDIPTPIALPFGYFPNRPKRSSGILTPGYGEESLRGFYLKNLGYYFALSDYADLILSGDIYSYGSWAVYMNTKYKLRYRFSGSMQLSLNKNVIGEKGLENYNAKKEFKINWTHQQDPKANPSRSITANVDFSSSSYNKYNEQNIGDFLKNTKSSSINYTKRFLGTPFIFSANMKGSQNTNTSLVDLSLPLLTFNMAKQYPFAKVNKTSKGKFYERIGISYSAAFSNTVSTLDTLLFTSSTLSKFRNGFQHSIPVSTSLKILKYIDLSPGFNYKGRVYTNSIRKYWDDKLYFNTEDSTYENGRLVTDTLKGINHVYDWDINVPFSTTLYGMFNFKHLGPVKAIRHKVTPSVGFSYRPDFSQDKYSYYDYYYDNATDTTPSQYSYFDNGIYGTAPKGKSGNINFSLSNNLEMKVKSKKDTSEAGLKKVILLDRLNISSSYNLAADSLNLANISLSGSTRLLDMFTINFASSFDPYSYNESTGTRINKFYWNEHQKIGRLINASLSTGITLNSNKLFKKEDGQQETGKGQKDAGAAFEPEIENKQDFYDNGYVDFSIPWNVRADYSLSISKNKYNPETKEFEPSITSSIRYGGNLTITENWKLSFNSGYDFTGKKATTTSLNITRDLHCWQMQFKWVPFGIRKSYFFQINLKSAILEGLEFKREESWYDNL